MSICEMCGKPHKLNSPLCSNTCRKRSYRAKFLDEVLSEKRKLVDKINAGFAWDQPNDLEWY